MGILLERIKKQKLLVADGAWGTLLQSKGMTPDDCPEEWNVSHPDVVQWVAKAYADAGADFILTDTFGGTSLKLKKMGHAGKVEAFNVAGIKNSLKGAPKAVVAGDVGPLGELIEPYGPLKPDEVEKIFSEQIAALIKGGAKVIAIETMAAVEEAAAAVRAAKKLDPKIDVAVTMTFEGGKKGFRTMMGVTPAKAAKELDKAGADVIGSNCGNGIEQMVEIAKEIAANTDKPILIKSNAGKPELIGGKTVFKQTPEHMASKVEELVKAGAKIVGGCCGTTPDHIKAMKAAIDKLRK